LLFGTDARAVRYVATDAFFQPARDYPGFTALANECAGSRIWAGVHFRTASDAGQHLGEAIANHVVGSLLRPLRENEPKEWGRLQSTCGSDRMPIDPRSLCPQRCCSVIGKVSRRLRPMGKASFAPVLDLRGFLFEMTGQ